MTTRETTRNRPRRPVWAQSLLRWYDASHRDLPWRGPVPAYHIWISEIMLQQTRVETVIPYYHRFLRQFPDVHTLAGADPSDVLKCWEGLGYYSRARNLHRAAGELVKHHKGVMPVSSHALRALPGIGAYTAAAIASISAGEPVPVLDGNVARVMARFLGLHESIAATGTRRHIEEHLRSAIPHGQPGDFNQALMELGALVCKPGRPTCKECPLRRRCVARRDGLTDRLPVRKTAKPLPHHRVAVGVVRRQDQVLIVQRRRGMLRGLWEFPGGKPLRKEKLKDALVRTIAEETNCRVRPEQALCRVRQEYSHFGITLHAFLCRPLPGRPRRLPEQAAWVPLSRLNEYAFGRAARNIIETLLTRESSA